MQEDINSDAKIIDDFNKQKTELNNATQNGNLVSSIWAGIYAKTDEYKDAKTQRDTEEKDATKRIKRIESLNTRISAAETKRKKAKSKSEREMYSKYIEELKSERDEEKQALETDTENIEELDKTIKNGPNKSFKEFMKNVKDSIKDITKFTSALSKTAGENIFSHFTYGGTKKDFESGKMAHNYAGYGSTQNVWYENLKKDRDYLLSLSSLSTETKEYIQKNWRDLGDEMHAMVYGSAEDLKQIDQNIQQMKKNDTESAWDTYTSNIKYTAEWSDKLYELAELGFNANALKEIIDMGYSEESMQIVDNLLRMLKSGNETIRQEALTLGSNSAKSVTQSISDRIVEAYTYAGATPEQQKALKELFGLTDKNEKAVEKDATALSSNTVAWLISKLDPDETASGSKLLIDGITTGLLDQDKLQTLVDAATYVGKLTTDTINGVLNGTIDSGNVTSLPETSLTKVKDTYLEKVLSKVPESQKKRRQKITDAFNAAEANGSLTGQVLNDIDTYLTSGQKITGDKIISLINGEYAAGAVTKFIKSISDTSFNKWNEMLKHGAINSKAFSDSILTVLNDVNPNVYAIAGKMILKGMRKGLVDDEEISKLTKAASETGYLTIQTIADILQIHSPSRVTFKMGEYLNLGLANGLDASSLVSQEAAQNSAYAVLTELGSVDASNIQPTIAPVVDQDSLLAATQQLNGLVTQSTAQLAAQAQYQLDHNKAIQNFNQQVEFDDSQLISEITSMHSDMMKLQEYVGQLKITMDTGAVVGAIAPQMDKTLGQRVNRRGR